ncbi:MAG: hypothetical protein PUC00_03150 [Clostridiales bacterium]|nr:hypothetical protein [Clostridiales bacterium]
MKRICSMILVLALLCQLLPVQALAQAGLELPSASELAAARALTGLAEDAPGYHAGMSVSTAMNAMQLSGWLDELLDNEMYSLQSAYQNIQTTLERMKTEDPNYYGIMTDTPNNRQYLPRIESLHHQSEELREELSFYSHRLTEQSYVIDSMMDRLSSDEYSETEKARAARKLESAAETIREIRETVVQNAADWEKKIDRWMSVLRGDYIGEDQETFVESSWVYIVMEWNPVIAQTQTSAAALYPKGETLLARLSPVRSALADTEQDVTLNVVSQKNFVVSVKHGSIPVQLAAVCAQQGGDMLTGTPLQNGGYSFNVSDFQMNADGEIELDLLVSSPFCRSVHFKQLCVKKGQILNVSLKTDDGCPYVLEATLDDSDILHNQYGIYYSSFNDLERSINVTVSGVEDGVHYCALEYTDASSGKRVRTEVQAIQPNKQTVTFRGKWNQLLKPGEKLEILLGDSRELQRSERFLTSLTVQRGPVEKPLFETTKAFSDAFNPLGSGFLSFTLPATSNMPKFISGSTLTLELPFDKYIPRLVINMDGSFSFSVGYQATSLNPNDTVDANGQKVERWKTQDQIELDKSQKKAIEESGKTKYIAKAGAMWDGCKNNPVRFLGKANASVSVFMYLYGRYQHDDQGYGSIRANGGIGLSFTFNAEIMQTDTPFFFNVGLTASLATTFQVGLLVDTYWPDGGSLTLGKLKIVEGMTGFTILLRLQVEISFGVGIKGLLSASVHGYGYISVLLELMGDGLYVTVSGRVGFYVLVQVFLLKWKITLYDMGETTLYTNKKKSADNFMLRILEPFLPSAVAESSSEAPEDTSLTPESYPKLEISSAQAVLSDVSMAGGDVQLLTLNGETFAFYLDRKGDGAHVKWVNLNDPARSGDFSHILSEHGMSGLIDYDFTVGKVAYQQIDPNTPTFSDMGVLCVLATPSMQSVYTEMEDGKRLEMQEPTQTIVYNIGFTGKTDGQGKMQHEFFGSSDLSKWNRTYVAPTITLYSAKVNYDRNLRKALYYVDISAFPMEQQSAGRQEISRLHVQSRHDIVYDYGYGGTYETKKEDERSLYSAPDGMKCYQVQRGSSELFGQDADEYHSYKEVATRFDSVYTLVCEKESPLTGETQLIHRTNGLNSSAIELDRGQIRYYKAQIGEVQGKKQTDMLFYLVEEAQGKQQCRLKGIRVEHTLSGPSGKRETMSVDSAAWADYDVIVPASSFDVATIDGTTYLYWLEAVEPQSAADAKRYRISGVIYDPVADRMSDDFVLAEFVPERSDDEPQKIMLTRDGKGYFIVNRGEGDSATATLYSFSFQYVPSLDLKKIALADTLVSAGSYNDLVFTITNDGNTAISSFDLQLQLLENGSSTTVQTIHADIVSPDQSYSQTRRGTVNGETSIYRMEDAAEPLVQSEWHIQRKHRKYNASGSSYTETENAQSAETGQLLPGMTAAFKTSLWIPANWEGKKQVRLQLSRWSALRTGGTGNARAVANGLEEEIVYELQSDGTMVRVQAQPYALMRTNAQPESSLYTSSIPAAQGISLSAVHDIELDYRLYRDADDVQWVSLVITDEAATAEPIHLTAQVYLDDSAEPIYVALPYYDRSVSAGGTHSIDLPVSALLGGKMCHKARIAVHGIGVEERDDADNEILLVFNQSIPALAFALQPQDDMALEGEMVTLSVEPVGGVKPYAYQWQVAGLDGKWTDVEFGTADMLNVGPVTKEMQGWRYRCQVTDHYLTKAYSDEAKLTVMEAVPTGDESGSELYLAAAVCALLVLLLRRRKRQPE